MLLFQVEEYSRADSIFQSILDKDPNNQIAKDYQRRSKIESTGKEQKLDESTEKKYMEGMALYLNGKYAEAIAIWEEILVDQPYNKRVNQAIQGAKDKMGTE
jgi:tetratricopeptide (TPR) repeat protein